MGIKNESTRHVHNLRVGNGSVVLIPGDIHCPIEDTAVIGLMCRAASDAGVTDVVLQGDTFDGWGMSTHPKEAERWFNNKSRLSDEVSAGKRTLGRLRGLVSGDEHAVAIAGNHDGQRLERFINSNPAFYGLKWYDLYAGALKGPNGSWTTPDVTTIKAGPLNIAHGHTLSGLEHGGGVTPCRTVLSKYPGQNTIFGHTHRRSFDTRPTWKDGRQVVHGAWNVGHLQDPKHIGSWAGDHAWEQSFALVSFHSQPHEPLVFDVALARILRDRKDRPSVLINGKVYR